MRKYYIFHATSLFYSLAKLQTCLSKRCLIFIFFSTFLFNSAVAQTDPYKWNRLPSDSEINNAKQDLINQLTQTISVNGKVVDQKNVRLSPLIKMHVKTKVGQLPPEDISRLIVFVEVTGIMGSKSGEYNLFQNKQTGKFGFARHADYINTIDERYSNMMAHLDSYPNNGSGLARGFAPSIGSKSTTVNKDMEVNGDIPDEDDEFPWEVVIIGTAIGAAVVAIRKKLKKGKAKNKKKESKEEEKEKAGYILQLSTKEFDFSEEKQGNLEVRVIKITETSEKYINAAIQIINPEPALQIQPSTGTTTFNCQLFLKEQPKNNQFKITVVANAEGHQYQKDIEINAGGEPKIVFETAPGNKRSLRPDIKRLITLYAQVIDANNKPIEDLSRLIDFTPIGDWAEISESAWDDGWKGIDIGAGNPNSVSISSHPPATMEVLMRVEMEDDKEPLEEKLIIHLLDCYLESEMYHCTFPVTEEKSKIRFKVWVENAGEEIEWNFTGMYRIGVDIEDDPLTEISFEKESETEVWVTLTGPILLPSEDDNILTKTLVIGAFQGEEEPIESHITVSVSREGLFLEDGFKNKNEIHFTAKGDIEDKIYFSLYNFNENTKQIVPDPKGLEFLEFNLINEEIAAENIHNALQIRFLPDKVSKTNIIKASYYWEAPLKFPGFGDYYNLLYEVKAPATHGTQNPEAYNKLIKMVVQSYGIGEEFPEWSIAYKNCKYTIWEYIPDSSQRNDMLARLEAHKYKLDVEGLVKFRKMIWSIAHDLIINKRDGYLSIANWCDAIIDTLDWVVWMGDLAFQVLLATFTGPGGALAASTFKETFLTIIAMVIEDKSFEDFIEYEIKSLEEMAFSVAKGKAINTRNIERVYKGSKWKVWALFAGTTFAAFYLKTGSIPESAKMTARELRDEAIIRFLSVEMNKIKTQREVNKTDENKNQSGDNDAEKLPKIKSKRVQEKLSELQQEIRTDKLGTKYIDKKKVVQIMEDPALVRTIKKHGSPELKKAFNRSRKKIYDQHDRRLIEELAKELKMNPKDLEVDDFRTPGDTSDNINTDRDYRVLRKVKLANGKVAKIEVSRKVFEAKSNRIFGELTDKPPHVSDADWAARKQQLAGDFTCDEANIDYSDQKIDPKTGERTQGESNIIKVKDGKSVLKNPNSMGDMYKNKVKNAGERPEKYAQAQKATKTIKKVKQGYEKQHFKTKPTSDKLKKAMKVIDEQPTDVDMTPKRMAETHKKLQDLDYDNGLDDVMKDIDGEFKSLKNVTKKGLFERLFG